MRHKYYWNLFSSTIPCNLYGVIYIAAAVYTVTGHLLRKLELILLKAPLGG